MPEYLKLVLNKDYNMYIDNNKNQELKKIFNEIDYRKLGQILEFWNPSNEDVRYVKYYFVLTQQYEKAAKSREVERLILGLNESDEYINEKMQECVDILFDKLDKINFLDSLKREGLI